VLTRALRQISLAVFVKRIGRVSSRLGRRATYCAVQPEPTATTGANVPPIDVDVVAVDR